MAYFEDIGFIPENASLYDKIVILSLMRPRLIYGLQLGAMHHQIGNEAVEITKILEHLAVELNNLISRVSFKQFKLYAKNLHVVNREFWKTYPQIRDYVRNLDQKEEIDIKARIAEKERQGPRGGGRPNREVACYMRFEDSMRIVITSLNDGTVPTDFLIDKLSNYLEQVVIQQQATPDLWISIAEECLNRNQIENAISAMEEAYWVSDVMQRHDILRFMKEKLSNIEANTPLLKYYSYALKWYHDESMTFHEPAPDDELSKKHGSYYKLAHMFFAMAPGGTTNDPLLPLPPTFRLKSTVLLCEIFYVSYQDLVTLLRKLEDLLQHIILWGAKDNDLSPLIRGTIESYHAKQEHETGITESIADLIILEKSLSKFKKSGTAGILTFDLLRAFLHFNRLEHVRERFEKTPIPSYELSKSDRFVKIDERYSTKATYLANYAILKLWLEKDSTSFDKFLTEFSNEITTVKSERQFPATTGQYRIVFCNLITILLDYSEQTNVEVYLDQLFKIAEKANVETQFLFATSPLMDSQFLARSSSLAFLREKFLKLAMKLLYDNYQDLVTLCTSNNNYLYLTMLIRVIIIFSDNAIDFKKIISILIENVKKPFVRDKADGSSGIKGNIIDGLFFDSWVKLFRDVNNYIEVLDELVQETRNSNRLVASYYIELCLVRLMVEHKNPLAEDRFLSLGELLWSYDDPKDKIWQTKHRLLSLYIEISSYFGLTSMKYLDIQYGRWEQYATNPETPSSFTGEVGLALASAASKVEGDSGLALRFTKQILNTNKAILDGDLTKLQSPYVLFDGISALLGSVGKLNIEATELAKLYLQAATLVKNFLDSKYMAQPGNETRLTYPIRALARCTFGLAILGDIEDASEMLSLVVTKVSSITDDHQLKFISDEFFKILEDDSGPLRNRFINELVKIFSNRLITCSKDDGVPDPLFENISQIIKIIRNSNSVVTSELRRLRGAEDYLVISEIYNIMRRNNVLY